MHLQTPLASAIRTTKEHIAVLHSMGIDTVEDFIQYLPRDFEDLSQIHTIATAPLEQKVSIVGEVSTIKLIRTKTGKQLVTAKFTDSEGISCDLLWFNQPHIKRMLRDKEHVTLTGKLIENGYKLQMQSPQIEKQQTTKLTHGGRIVPVYPQHDVITSKWIREKMQNIRHIIPEVPETLPVEVLAEHKLLSRADAYMAMHFPKRPEDIDHARYRFTFEKLYIMQKQALEKKQEWKGEPQKRLSIPMNVHLIKEFFSSLHFTPTNSQKVAIYEILKDLEKHHPMSRLLEGDVGSGKTLVATAVAANVIQHGGQCALMVPTEVLAKQHAESIGRTLIGFHNFCAKNGISMRCPRIALLTGSVSKVQANTIKNEISHGAIDLVIGTHALIEDSVHFQNLLLVIVDEQHRFGVIQRNRLQDKGNPHFLSMTATPIPRTLALTAYGHHDLSVLTEKPGNRKPIHTKVISPTNRRTVELFIDNEIQAGRQVFVICPLISESTHEDMMEIRNVESEVQRLKESFSSRSIAMLHGKMTPFEKERIMKEFKEQKYDILVSTSVIEVGIDVPNATIIVIEGAERFGLSQLHQFRGRVGRGDHKSYCYLFTTTPQQSQSPRLKAMEKYDSGFQLAEIDLKLRGPGELFGLKQSGVPEGVAAHLIHPELVLKARTAAQKHLGIHQTAATTGI